MRTRKRYCDVYFGQVGQNKFIINKVNEIRIVKWNSNQFEARELGIKETL